MTTLTASRPSVHSMRPFLIDIRLNDAAQFLGAQFELDFDLDVLAWSDRSESEQETYRQRVESVLRIMERPMLQVPIEPAYVSSTLTNRVREVVWVLLTPKLSRAEAREQAVQMLLSAVSDAAAVEIEARFHQQAGR